MIKLRNEYRREVPLDIDEIIDSISHSVDFIKEDSPNWSGQFYTRSIMNKIVFRQKSKDIIQISENAGLGGMLEIIGEIKIIKKGKKGSAISVGFQMGSFPIITPYILIVLFGLGGFIFIFIDLVFSYILFGLTVFSLLIMIIKQERVSFFLKGMRKH